MSSSSASTPLIGWSFFTCGARETGVTHFPISELIPCASAVTTTLPVLGFVALSLFREEFSVLSPGSQSPPAVSLGLTYKMYVPCSI